MSTVLSSQSESDQTAPGPSEPSIRQDMPETLDKYDEAFYKHTLRVVSTDGNFTGKKYKTAQGRQSVLSRVSKTQKQFSRYLKRLQSGKPVLGTIRTNFTIYGKRWASLDLYQKPSIKKLLDLQRLAINSLDGPLNDSAITEFWDRLKEVTEILKSQDEDKMHRLDSKLEEPTKYKPDAKSWAVLADDKIKESQEYSQPDMVWEFNPPTDAKTETHDDDDSSTMSAGSSASQ